MSRQKQKGTWLETTATNYGNRRLGGDDIHRAALAGSADRGDLHGLKIHGKPVVIECKNCGRYEIPKWLEEAEIERGNADAEFGVVLFHLKGVGEKRFGQNAVVMTYDTLLGIAAGSMSLLED